MHVAEGVSFGEYIHERRKQKGYSLRVLADVIKVNFTYLSKLETGSVQAPSNKVIDALAIALELPKDELYSRASKVAPDLLAMLMDDPDTVKLLRNRQKQKARSDSSNSRH